MGEKKFENYGEEILKIIRTADRVQVTSDRGQSTADNLQSTAYN